MTKRMKALVMMTLVIGLAATVTAQDKDHKVTVLSNRMDILYLKVSEAYVGGSVTVIDTTGTEVMTTIVSGKKILVDFFSQVSGNYTVRIEKGEFSEELKYHKF
jgi:hypothetical protein